MRRVIVLLACVALVASVASAALTRGQEMAVDALIKQFSAPDFDARQKAVDRLVEMGADVAPIVQKALDETKDAEVKMRCEMVLKALGGAKPAAPATPAKTDYGPSKVTLDVKDMPLVEVVEKLAEQSGNKRINVADNLKDKTVTLAVKDVTYWEAVQAVCDKLGLVLMNDWRRMTANGEDYGWFQFLEAQTDAKLTAFSGPIMVKPDGCTKYLPYRLAKTGNMMGWRPGLSFSVTYLYEDRLEPLLSSIEVKSLLGPDGKNYAPVPSVPQVSMGMFMGRGNVKLPPHGTVQVTAAGVPDDLQKLAEMSGIVRLECGTGQKEVTIDDVVNAVGKEMKFDDWTVKVLKAEPNRGGLQVQVEAKYKGEPTEIPAWMVLGSYGWSVKAAETAKKTRGYSWGGTGGRWVVGGQGEVVGANPAPAAPKKGESSVYFQGNFENGAYTLILTLPEVHETKEYPFTIKDIPLP